MNQLWENNKIPQLYFISLWWLVVTCIAEVRVLNIYLFLTFHFEPVLAYIAVIQRFSNIEGSPSSFFVIYLGHVCGNFCQMMKVNLTFTHFPSSFRYVVECCFHRVHASTLSTRLELFHLFLASLYISIKESKKVPLLSTVTTPITACGSFSSLSA